LVELELDLPRVSRLGLVRGYERDVVLLNAGAALVVGDKASDIAEGVKLAAEVIDSGAALEKLDKLVAFSQSLAESA